MRKNASNFHDGGVIDKEKTRTMETQEIAFANFVLLKDRME